MAETPEQVVERLGAKPLEALTKAESSALNRAKHALQLSDPDRPLSRTRAREIEKPVEFELAEAPAELDTPEGMRWLFRKSMRTVQRIIEAPLADPTVTNRDRLEAAAFLRLASGINKEAPATPLPRPMISHLTGERVGMDPVGIGEPAKPSP